MGPGQKTSDEAAKLRQILQDNSIPTFVIDKHHTLTHWNKACEILTGTAAGRIIGTSDHWKPFQGPAIGCTGGKAAIRTAALFRHRNSRSNPSGVFGIHNRTGGQFPGGML